MAFELAIPFSIFLSAIGIIVAIVVSHVRGQHEISRIKEIAMKNEHILTNPEDSGIGTFKTNMLLTNLTEYIKDSSASHAAYLSELRQVIQKNTESQIKTGVIMEQLSAKLDHT